MSYDGHIMSRHFYPALVFSLLLGGAYWLLKDEVHFLMGYQGKIVRVYRDEVANGSTGGINSDTMVEIETAGGRVKVEVPHNVFVDARPGMTITKRRFSNRVILQ